MTKKKISRKDRMDKINKINSVHSVNSACQGVASARSLVKKLPDRLKDATKPAMVLAAPGKWVPYKAELPPDVSLCRWLANGDGTFSAIPFTERMVRLDQRLGNILGFADRWDTLRRLAGAGFIEIIQITPHCSMINLDSYYNHLRRCAEDSEFWDHDGEAYKAYTENLRRVVPSAYKKT